MSILYAMDTASLASPTAVVSGGSLSGLMIAIVLKDLGYSVTVLERSLTVESQGAGIVLGRWSTKFFQVFDKTETEIGVPALRRQFFNKDGSTMFEEKIKLGMTSWDKLYYTLRANFDGHVQDGYLHNASAAAENDSKTHYFMGRTVLSHSYDPGSKKVKVTYRNKDENLDHIEVDLFVCAEGASSTSREIYFSVPRSYSGYLAFRGLVPEADLDPVTAKTLVGSLSVSITCFQTISTTHFARQFIHDNESQFLCYTIPGPHGSTAPGERYMNFVWYNNFPEGSQQLETVMTDKEGKRRPYSVTTGSMSRPAVEGEVHPRARAKLSPQCLEVVMKAKYPFVQLVTDVISPAAVFHGGHVLLVGDAMSGARPHTTASTNQAADHALRLHAALQRDPRDLDSLVKAWEPETIRYAKHLWDIGAKIGNLSQFGDHPMNVHRESQDRPLEEWMKVGEPK